MEIIPYSSRTKIDKEFKNIQPNRKNSKNNLINENEFISLINKLSTSIKEYYLIILNIIKDFKNNSFELNKYILTSKCLINEMNNNKANFQEKYRQFLKNIEGMNLNNKLINNNIILFEINVNKLFNDSKAIFKRMKEFKKNKNNNIFDNNTYIHNTNNNNHIIFEQNNINQYNNKINCLKLSLDTRKLNSFSHKNKSNNIDCNSKKIMYTKDKKENLINLSQSNFQNMNNDNLSLLGDMKYLEKKIRNKNNKNKTITCGKSNSLTNIKYNINNIMTDKSISHINKIKYLFDSSPQRNRKSNSNEKNNPFNVNYNNNNNNYYSNRVKCSSSGKTTSRKYDKNEEDYYSSLNYNNFRNDLKYITFDSIYSDNTSKNNILELFEKLVEYFFSLTQFQNSIINKTQNSDNTKAYFLKIKNALIQLNNSIIINNDILIKNNMQKKLYTIINLNENINQKLTILKSGTINHNNRENIFTGFQNNNNNNVKSLKNIFKSDYNKIIEKLKNENQNLFNINQKITNQNKLLNQKLNLKEMQENNKNINTTINKLSKENKEYIFQINNLKKDNEELLKLITNKKTNGKEKVINNSNTNSHLLDILNENKDDKNNKIKKLEELLEENKIINNKLKENEKEKDNKIKKLNEEIVCMKNKYNTNITLIKEKNILIDNLKKELNKLKEEQRKNMNNIEEDRINKLKNNLINNNNKDKSKIENEILNLKNELICKDDKIENIKNKHDDLIDEKIYKNNLVIEAKDNNEIKNLKDKINELENKIKDINIEKNNLLIKLEQQIQENKKLESIINNLEEKLKNLDKNKINEIHKVDNLDIESDDKIDIHDIENDIINYKDSDDQFRKDKNINENKQYSIELIENNNNENQSKILSTPSFKSPELEDEDNNYKRTDKKEEIKDIKKLNDLLLNKIIEYESILKINQSKEEIKEINININNINSENKEIKYYQNKYIQYFKLYQDVKEKCEYYEKSNETLKNDLLKAESEIKELTKKLKENNIIIDNGINCIGSLHSLKLNEQYSPNDYKILCDKTYNQFKWFLMKRKYDEEEEIEETDNYDNLIWVPKIDIIDLNNFNKYTNEEEINNNIEMLNLIKKLEEKENIISKLSYKLDKIEKEIEYSNIYNTIGQELKNKNSKINSFLRNNINEEYMTNDNGYIISIRKESTKSQKNMKSEENCTPLEKFNDLLQKLNQTEEKLMKLQNENIELRKYQKSQNNGNQINIISNDKRNNISDNKIDLNNNNNLDKILLENRGGLVNINKNRINNVNNNLDKSDISEESEYYYKNKYNELEMKIKILKEACKNILLRLNIPKKDKEEIKQILKLFEFTEEETLYIIGDRKK